jgi:hypothetical protein
MIKIDPIERRAECHDALRDAVISATKSGGSPIEIANAIIDHMEARGFRVHHRRTFNVRRSSERRGKPTERQIREVHRLWKTGKYDYQEIANRTGLTTADVSWIKGAKR